MFSAPEASIGLQCVRLAGHPCPPTRGPPPVCASSAAASRLREQAQGAGDLWWDDRTIRTRPTQDRSKRMEAADFVGDLLRLNDAHGAEAPARVAALLVELRGSGDLAALRQEVDWGAVEAAAGDFAQQAEPARGRRTPSRPAGERGAAWHPWASA